MPHIYTNVRSLEKHDLIGDGNCVALVQRLTNVGHTSTWRPDQRVVDDRNIAPGTAIATFQNERYPNVHTGNHAALYLYSGPNSPQTGKPTYIVVMDQWIAKGRVTARTILSRKQTKAQGGIYYDSDNAETFYIIK